MICSGSPGISNKYYNGPVGITSFSSGSKLAVSDTENNRICVINTSSGNCQGWFGGGFNNTLKTSTAPGCSIWKAISLINQLE